MKVGVFELVPLARVVVLLPPGSAEIRRHIVVDEGDDEN